MIRQAVVLVGGLATRLGAMATDRPKALQVVAGRPFLDHQLALLQSQGVEEVVLCVGHLGEHIVAHVGDGRQLGLDVRYSWDGPNPVGTAGAIRNALPLLDDCFFVEYGDTYLRAPLAAIASTFLTTGRLGLMTVYRNDNALEPSNVAFERGAILVYDKQQRTPNMHHIDFGLSAFRREVFASLPSDRSVDLTTVFADLLGAGQLAGVEVSERFYEIGTPASLAETTRLLSGFVQPSSPP